jgi:hypothetical protein
LELSYFIYNFVYKLRIMANLTKIDLIFLEDPKRMEMGKGKLSSRYKVSEEEIEESRARVKAMISAKDLVNELESKGYKGSIKDAAKTIISGGQDVLEFQIDIVKRQFEGKVKAQEDKYKSLLTSYEDLDERYTELLQLDKNVPFNVIPIIPGVKRQGASIIAVSDWHVGKLIEKNSVNGFNEYNPEVAKKRSQKFTESTIKLINKDSQEFDKHDTILFLNGDFIEGYIHPESQRVTNTMTPIEEVAFAQELLANSIENILEQSSTDRITVVCRNGNHSRNTKRMESSIDHRTNYESILYAFLAQKFRDDVQFNLPISDIGYTHVLGKTIRDFHGWQVSYGGGIGGLTVPLTKFIQRQDGNKKADYNILGHFHQLSLPTKDSMLNGSLCGFDTYAQSLGCSKEPALQGYRLIDSKYGFTSFNPIICE